MWEWNNYANLSDDELKHHGVLGMKWGVRRYQNPDGSLTPKGKKKLGKYIEKRRATDRFMNNVYDIKNKKARSELIKELKYEPNETDTVTLFNKYHKNKISNKEIKSICKSIDRMNKVYQINNRKRGQQELNKIFKQMKKAEKIINKYDIQYDKPSIVKRNFNSLEEMNDFYELYRNS